MAIALGGCWAAALQFAPLGLRAAEAVGAGAVDAAKMAAGSRSRGSAGSEDDVDREERCDALQLEIPGLIEVRQSKSSAPQWRELQLGGSTDAPQWVVNAGKDRPADGWRPAVNLTEMNFAPPIQGSLESGRTSFLAYAPAAPQNSVERDQLVAMTVDFGLSTGTFRSNGRTYQYTVVRDLPCFPGPVALR